MLKILSVLILYSKYKVYVAFIIYIIGEKFNPNLVYTVIF